MSQASSKKALFKKKDKKKLKQSSLKTQLDKTNKLTAMQEEFCQLYVSMDRDMFGNGTQCYIEAYGVDLTKKGAYDRAKACAYENLTKPYIIERINELLESGGFNDENVEKQHLFLLNQHADFKTKMKAIDSFYKLKGKFAPEELDINVTEITRDKYDKIIRRESARLKTSIKK